MVRWVKVLNFNLKEIVMYILFYKAWPWFLLNWQWHRKSPKICLSIEKINVIWLFKNINIKKIKIKVTKVKIKDKR